MGVSLIIGSALDLANLFANYGVASLDAPTYVLDATVVVLKAGAAGLLLGWIFWRWGLPYAITCHGATNGIHLLVMPVFF
jgi:membrane protease YdiL (CAAX protease family)